LLDENLPVRFTKKVLAEALTIQSLVYGGLLFGYKISPCISIKMLCSSQCPFLYMPIQCLGVIDLVLVMNKAMKPVHQKHTAPLNTHQES